MGFRSNKFDLAKIKLAYIRLHVAGRTFAFYSLGKGHVPSCNGLFFGAITRTPAGWVFFTTAAVANGRTVEESAPAIISYGKQRLGW